MPVGHRVVDQYVVFKGVEKDHVLDPGRRIRGKMDLIGIFAAAYRRGGVNVVLVLFGHDLLVQTEISGSERDYVVAALGVDEFVGVGIGIKIRHKQTVGYVTGTAGGTSVVGITVADIFVARLISNTVENVVAELGYRVPGMVGSVVKAVRGLCRLIDTDNEQSTAAAEVVGLSLYRILVLIQSLGVGIYYKRRFVKRSAVRKQVVEHTALLFDVDAFAALAEIALVHRDRPRQNAALIQRIVLETHRFRDSALSRDAYNVIDAGFRSSLNRRSGIVGTLIDRGARGVDYCKFVLVFGICSFYYSINFFATEQRHVRLSAERGAVVLIRRDKAVTGAGVITEYDCLAARGNIVARSGFGGGKRCRRRCKRTDRYPFVGTELGIYGYGFIGLVGHGLCFEALSCLIKVSVEHRVRYYNLIKTVFAGIELYAAGLADKSDADPVVGELYRRRYQKIVVRVSVCKPFRYRQRISRRRRRGVPCQISDLVDRSGVVRIQVEAADIF